MSSFCPEVDHQGNSGADSDSVTAVNRRWPASEKEPSLRAAYSRASRARWRNYELFVLTETTCRKFSELFAKSWLGANAKRRVLTKDQIEDLIEGRHPIALPDVPLDVSMLVGEVTYNLRAALDYLVCQLSLLQTPKWSGKKERRNQFPIESTEAGFDGRRASMLAGVSDRHAALIRTLQPFAGCPWTPMLATLSNVDKHNDLIEIRQGFTLKTRAATQKRLARLTFDDFFLVLSYGEHQNLVTVLDVIIEGVDGALNTFRDEFPFDLKRYKDNRERFRLKTGIALPD